MRSFAHWTPRYIVDRCREAADHKLRPRDPWLTRESIGLLERLLRPTDTMIEFGSGRSTLWFAGRVSQMISIEHNVEWHKRVGQMLVDRNASNVDLRHYPRDAPESENAGNTSYVRVLEEFSDNSVDVVLVDGVYRNHCALGSIPKLKAGGLLILDNANWVLPSDSRSPTSRLVADGPAGSTWSRVSAETSGWRRIWTTSGVTDTLILFKP